jgi:eukaryotic-like serine/threonine-protein kinase
LTQTEPVPTEALLLSSQRVTGAILAGRYRLAERIGRGGMADVFAAQDDLLSRRVAVKIFRFDLCTDDELHRVHAEMQTLAALHHPGLVTVFDAGTVHEAGAAEQLASPYLVMELVKGPNLGQRLSEGPLSQADTAQLGTELAATLAYVHARNVIHRDVKPANILLGSSIADDAPFASKLTDFGIARVVDSTHHTQAGFTLGTANYLSPEQALSAEVGPPTDVYSLGLVLLECLTGELAYPGSGIEAALARLNRQPEIPAGLGSGWRRLLVAATEREPANRPTAAELGADLRTLAAGGALPGWLPVADGETGLAGLVGTAGAAGAAGLGSGALPAGRQTGAPLATGTPAAFRPADEADPDDEPITEAWLTPSAPPRHRYGGVIAAAVLVLAALLTSGYLLRAGQQQNRSPGAPVNFTSTHTVPSSTPASSVAVSRSVSAVASVSSDQVAGRPSIATSVVTQTVTRSVTQTSAVPRTSAPTSPSVPPSSGSATGSPSSSASASTSATSSASGNTGNGHGRGGH